MPIGAYYPSEREKLKRDAANPDSPRGLAHYPAYTQHQTPTLPRHAPPPPRQQQKSQQPPPQQQASGSNSASTSSSALQSDKSVQQGVTQIVLPPPTTSETLNIQEYQPPSKQNPYPVLGADSPGPRAGQGHNSQSPPAQTRQTRSSSRSHSQSHNSPYLANANTPATSASPPSVPPTFASIMNAYPAPGGGPSSNGSGSGGAE